jgi:ribosomal protein S18 acetylase RimI-like enzyme
VQLVEPRVVAERDGVLLRHASAADLAAVDALTATCYAPIQRSFVELLGKDLYQALGHSPWEQRKTKQNRDLFREHPGQVWVLDDAGDVFGFVTFWLFPDQSYGHLDNNGVHPDRAGQGWATFMYRAVLEHFRELGLRYAHVDTGLDDAHIPARRAYEAVGFDRAVPTVDYWLALDQGYRSSAPCG